MGSTNAFEFITPSGFGYLRIFQMELEIWVFFKSWSIIYEKRNNLREIIKDCRGDFQYLLGKIQENQLIFL